MSPSPFLRLAIFGDAGNSYTNGTSFYYSPGSYRRFDLGASGPLQQAVAEMMRSWKPTDIFQLGDESYNTNASSLLDINIGQYYNDWIYPYAPPAYSKADSIYSNGALGGIPAIAAGKQWPYNLYNYPYGFPNPTNASQAGGSADGVNHYFAVPGNHDEATILGGYNDTNVSQVSFGPGGYIGPPIGPDAYDYQNNISTYPGQPFNVKIGSNQQLLDYHAYLGEGNAGNLKAGSLKVGKLDPDGYGIYYSVDLGDDGGGHPLLHVTIIDTSRLLTDAGYYSFNFQKPATGFNLDDPQARKNPGYDVRRSDLTADEAQFQPADWGEDTASIGRQMFLWAQEDLQRSTAAWNIVMGHHPAYHTGNSKNDDDDSYSNNAVILNFLQGLRSSSGASLFDAYMNGHSHAYGRVLEMETSADGIGTGIPFFTIGDSGKNLDALNLAPYGSNVLTPINYSTFIGYDLNGHPLYNSDLNNAAFEATYLQPYQAGRPTSTGVSGYYTYSKSNYPAYDGNQAAIDPNRPTDPSERTITTSDGKIFTLKQAAYGSSLASEQSDLSGLYGFGSGAAQLDAGDTYLMVHYQTARPIDPAIALIARRQGVNGQDPASLFYQQWSPRTAKLEDLALFSFDIDAQGSLTHVQLVQGGNGYFEADLAGSDFVDVEQDFEILGNNPLQPLGFSSSDPTRAVVRLSFRGGRLSGVSLVHKGSDYQQLANAIKKRNDAGSNTVSSDPRVNNSLLVGINIDLEAQSTLAASRPNGSDPYHDWYLITDTALESARTSAGGAFGAVTLSLQPLSQEARTLLATTAIPTGYSGLGPQQAFARPQAGELRLIDAVGSLVGRASVAAGSTAVTLADLPAPGALRLEYEGDATSSYLVNFRGIERGDAVELQLRYGSWSGPIQQRGAQLHLEAAQTLQVLRSDSGPGLVDFALTDGSTTLRLLEQAFAASAGALQAGGLFLDGGDGTWQNSERQALGGAGALQVAAGTWRPTAFRDGVELTLASLELEANGAVARFAAGRPDDSGDDVVATFSLPGTGATSGGGGAVLTVRRLGELANGLALYEADPVTGAVADGQGGQLLPGEEGYLAAALADAHRRGLVLGPEALPAFGQSLVRTDLPLDLSRNHAALLLVDGSEEKLLSSWAAANPEQSNQCLSLIAPGRGISFSFEDTLVPSLSDRDFNDLSVTLTPALPTLL